MPMKYLTPDIAKLSKAQSSKSLAKLGVSCGIFQDCLDTAEKSNYKNLKIKKENPSHGK